MSNTMDVEFCIEAVEEAMARHDRPDIFNTDQGSQFTSPRFTSLLTAAGIRVSVRETAATSTQSDEGPVSTPITSSTGAGSLRARPCSSQASPGAIIANSAT